MSALEGETTTASSTSSLAASSATIWPMSQSSEPWSEIRLDEPTRASTSWRLKDCRIAVIAIGWAGARRQARNRRATGLMGRTETGWCARKASRSSKSSGDAKFSSDQSSLRFVWVKISWKKKIDEIGYDHHHHHHHHHGQHPPQTSCRSAEACP